MEAPRPPFAAVDATGAGDSFDAGFIAGLLAGRPAEQCLRLAVRMRRAVDPSARRYRRPADAGRGGRLLVIVCAAANPSIDRLFEVERLQPGGIHRPAAFTALAGGKGLNVARAVACLGEQVHAVALVGGNAGRFIAEGLESEGIAASFAWCEGETRSSLSALDRSTGVLTEFYEQREPVSPDEWAASSAPWRRRCRAEGWLTLSGSLPPGAPVDGYARLISARPRRRHCESPSTRAARRWRTD